MNLKLVVFVICCSNYYCYAAIRAWQGRCGKGGFTCTTRNGSLTVTFQCPIKTAEYQVFVNEFNGPAHLDSFIIKNCKTVTILTRCTTYRSEKKHMKYLEVSNIETVKIEHSAKFHSQLPPTVVFKDIKLIESIPSFSFNQIDKRQNKARWCIMPTSDLHDVSFHNVSIGAIHSNAFHMPKGFGKVSFVNARINNFRTSSITASQDADGVFLMDRSTVEELQFSAFQISGKSVIFSESKFAKIHSSGINATTETFYFVNNSVNTLQPYALSIRSRSTFILNNHFGYLKLRAFGKIGPRSNGKSGGAGFGYDFSGNSINSTEADCLHPDVGALSDVSAKISFRRNNLPCTCSKSDWLISKTTNGSSLSPEKRFYSLIFDGQYENTCSSSCNLSIADIKYLILDNICLENKNLETLCQMKGSTLATTEAIPGIFNKSTIPFENSPTTRSPNKVNTLGHTTIKATPSLSSSKNTFVYGNTYTATKPYPTGSPNLHGNANKINTFENTIIEVTTSSSRSKNTFVYGKTTTEAKPLPTGSSNLPGNATSTQTNSSPTAVPYEVSTYRNIFTQVISPRTTDPKRFSNDHSVAAAVGIHSSYKKLFFVCLLVAHCLKNSVKIYL